MVVESRLEVNWGWEKGGMLNDYRVSVIGEKQVLEIDG